MARQLFELARADLRLPVLMTRLQRFSALHSLRLLEMAQPDPSWGREAALPGSEMILVN